MKCQEAAGFLVPRPCRNEATVQCSVCQKSVCGEHTASLPHGGLACTSCAGAQNVGPGVQRHQLQDYYGYHSGFSPGYGRPMYTASDYTAFETAGAETDGLQESLDGS